VNTHHAEWANALPFVLSRGILRRGVKPAEAGMTLIEVMLAVSILAIIVVLTWGSMSTSFRMRRASLDKFDRYRAVQMTIDRMAREISMSFVTNVGQVATNDAREVTYRTIFEGDSDELTFTSLSHLATRPGDTAGEQCELTYRLESRQNLDGEYVQALVRREDAPIDGDPEEGGIVQVALWDVENLTLEYWDQETEIAGDAWTRSWDAINDHSGLLPERVRITLEVTHPTRPEDTLTFMTQTQIQLVKPLIMVSADVAAAAAQGMQQIEDQLQAEGFEDFSNMTPEEIDQMGQQGAP
jgi:type II secretion system protein J